MANVTYANLYDTITFEFVCITSLIFPRWCFHQFDKWLIAVNSSTEEQTVKNDISFMWQLIGRKMIHLHSKHTQSYFNTNVQKRFPLRCKTKRVSSKISIGQILHTLNQSRCLHKYTERHHICNENTHWCL